MISNDQPADAMQIEIIARAVIVNKTAGTMLFCATKNKSHYYLPGGHVEFGESAAVALSREIVEEMGIKTDPAKFSFAGASENFFTQEGEKHHEINLYFRVPEELFGPDVASKEEHIIFEWISIEKNANVPILPKSQISMIQKWSEGNTILWSALDT